MGRLTQEDDLGNWKVKGVAWESLHEGQVITKETYEKLYGCLCKLKDYEASGYSPDELSGIISKPATQANRIRAMSEVELANFLDNVFNGFFDGFQFPCHKCHDEANCYDCFRNWLNEEVRK